MNQVVQYETEDGVCPFERWFNGLDAQAALKVRTAVAQLEAGNLSNVKSVGRGVAEARINWGAGYRVYFGREGVRLIILLAGGTKKRQRANIEAAKSAWTDYIRRKKERRT